MISDQVNRHWGYKMRFTATDEQVKQMAANAVNASLPMGMGHLHYEISRHFKATEFSLSETDDMHLDYVGGRMVKLNIWRKGIEEWEVRDTKPTPDYQSWCRKYPTYDALLESVGAKVSG